MRFLNIVYICLSLLLFNLSACKAPELKPQTVESSKLEVANDAHKGDWPLIEGENPRTIWLEGAWGMKAPDCDGDLRPISTLIMNYSDFNLEHNLHTLEKLIGSNQWAWSDKPFDEPDAFEGDNDIKVIIYKEILSDLDMEKFYRVGKGRRAISLEDVKKLYPTNKSKQLDFRYLSYKDAINYLDSTSLDMYREDLALILVKRKFEIKEMFCEIPH